MRTLRTANQQLTPTETEKRSMTDDDRRMAPWQSARHSAPLRSAGRPGLDLTGAKAHGEICDEDLGGAGFIRLSRNKKKRKLMETDACPPGQGWIFRSFFANEFT